MNEKEMIEEMAKVIIQASCKGSECETCVFTQIAEAVAGEITATCFCVKALYNAGYRKLPEDAVVLSKNEYEELNITGKYFNEALNKTRKETAKEIFAMLRSIGSLHLEIAGNDWNDYLAIDTNDFNKIAKQFRVEVEK